MRGRVLFVSKPVVPPFRDGTKCLVRDIAVHLKGMTPVVMSAREAPTFASVVPGGDHVVTWPVYAAAGDYRPGLRQNMRAVWSLLSGADADLWHFVFAPNPKSSLMGSWLKRVRRVPVVQTIASPPKSFAKPETLVFGDVVVAQSEWTKRSLLDAFAERGVGAPQVDVIPPPVPALRLRSPEEQAQARRRMRIPEDAPMFVYPGDLETSSGARSTADLVAPLREAVPDAVVVFAYRSKSAEANVVAARLQAELPPDAIRFEENSPDILALVQSAAAVLFPVDDLWGKVDLPIVLLETMTLGVPVMVYDAGPLSDLGGVVKIPDLQPRSWLESATRLVARREFAAEVVTAQRACIAERHRAERVSESYAKIYSDLLAESRAYSLER